jgi:hypothetical protein
MIWISRWDSITPGFFIGNLFPKNGKKQALTLLPLFPLGHIFPIVIDMLTLITKSHEAFIANGKFTFTF